MSGTYIKSKMVKVFLLKDCIASILKFSPGCDIELIVVNNNSKEKETFDFLENLKSNLKNKFNFVLLNISGEFNYSKIKKALMLIKNIRFSL